MPNKLNTLLADQYRGALGEIDNVVVIDCQALNSEKMAEFRANLNKASLSMTVVKNRIAAQGLKESGLKPLVEHDFAAARESRILRGGSALLHGGDGAVDAAKFVVKWLKENKDSIRIKGGQMGADVLDSKQVEAAATLPNRKELLSTMAGNFLAVPQKVAATFQAGYAQVLYAFSALAEKLEKQQG